MDHIIFENPEIMKFIFREDFMMRKIANLIIFSLITASFSVFGSEKKDPILGTWCVGEDGLVLTFSGKDTLFISSNSDTSINGKGTYKRNDTSFTASVISNDINMNMKYIYRWKGADTIEAKTVYFTVNGDTVDSPKEWTAMARCKLLAPAVKKATPQKASSSDHKKNR